MTNLLHKIIHVHAKIDEANGDMRRIILDYKKMEKGMMDKPSGAIEKMNALHVIGPRGKRMEFSLEI